jgi:hypothetical protein
MEGIAGACFVRHLRQVKNWRDSRGAARCRLGSNPTVALLKRDAMETKSGLDRSVGYRSNGFQLSWKMER